MQIKLDHKIIDLTSVDWSKWENETRLVPWKYAIVDFLKKFADNSDIIELKTSGSTGKPKIISARKKYLANSAKKTCEYFNLSQNSTGLLCMNASYIGAQMMLVRAIVSGMNLLTTEPKANPIKDISETIDFTAMVPYQVENCLNTPERFNQITNLIIGGGKTSSNLQQKLLEHSVNCYETYGMTETYSHIALKEIAPRPKDHFTCLKGISVQISSDNHLIISVPDLGIRNLKTNDIAELIDSKNFIWKGRIDFIINSGGIKISPEEIEAKIEPFIKEKFCIIGLPHHELGEQVTLIIESEPFNTNYLIKKIDKILPPYHKPKKILFISLIPETETGKVKRKVLIKLLT